MESDWRITLEEHRQIIAQKDEVNRRLQEKLRLSREAQDSGIRMLKQSDGRIAEFEAERTIMNSQDHKNDIAELKAEIERLTYQNRESESEITELKAKVKESTRKDPEHRLTKKQQARHHCCGKQSSSDRRRI